MRCVKIEDFDIICSTEELAEMLNVTPREVQRLTSLGFLTYISNYKQKGTKNRSRFYRLSVAIRDYERYLFEYKGQSEKFASDKSSGKRITIIEDVDITRIKENKKVYYE